MHSPVLAPFRSPRSDGSGREVTLRPWETPSGREMAARHQKDVPPDLNVVIVRWTGFIEDWRKQLEAVLPYREYIDTAPRIAEKFRAAIRSLIDTLEKFL